MSGGVRDSLIGALATHEWRDDAPWSAHAEHNFDGGCGVCSGDVGRIVNALLPVVERVVAEARAEAWDEGLAVGLDDFRSANEENPYRAALGRQAGGGE